MRIGRASSGKPIVWAWIFKYSNMSSWSWSTTESCICMTNKWCTQHSNTNNNQWCHLQPNKEKLLFQFHKKAGSQNLLSCMYYHFMTPAIRHPYNWHMVHYTLHKNNTHTHPFNGPFSGTTQVSWYQKGKPIWILLKQETVSGSGMTWAICKSALCSRQITTPTPHQSVFYRPDALPAAQPTASKHWRGRRRRSKVHSSLIFVLFCIA